jgi:hypothetical protein
VKIKRIDPDHIGVEIWRSEADDLWYVEDVTGECRAGGFESDAEAWRVAGEIARSLTTGRQRAVYIAIVEFWGEHRYAPSVREIMDAAGYKSTDGVCRALRKLRKLGLIDYVNRVARSITVAGAVWFPPDGWILSRE